MNQNDLIRKEVQNLKKDKGVSYKYLADRLNIKPSSFYGWVKGAYNLTYSHLNDLKKIIEEL